ncbi:MAG: hypothetical protein JWL62_1246 [Hyphomicrobiales bacterium]|nr:hypothetical protein [Hyphomicrobiales bacterium]
MSLTSAPKDEKHEALGDEAFMSADELRAYMRQMAMAEAAGGDDAVARAERAQKDMLETFSKPIEVTDEVIAKLKKRLVSSTRQAAKRGETEIMVMRFPNALCTDNGRAINNSEDGWPDTLTGRPRQAYEFWRDELRPAKYKLKAMIIDWPHGMPGDVGFFLSWASATEH